MCAAAKLFGTMGGNAARNQAEAGRASQRPEVQARRKATIAAKNGASRRFRRSTDSKKS
jgi:hypothetical protein